MQKIPAQFKNPKILIAASVITVLLISVVVLAGKNSSLVLKNKTLTSKLTKMQDSLESLEKENESFNSKLKGWEKEKAELKSSLESIRKESDALQIEIKEAQEKMTSALDEKGYLEEILIHKSKEIEKLKKNGAPPAQPEAAIAASSAPEDIDARIREKDEEIRKLNEQNSILAKKLERLYETTHSRMAEINVAKITLEETVSEARKKIEEEWNTVDLGEISSNPTPAPAKSSSEGPRQTKKEGKVLAVNDDHGFVVVDLGKVDNVKTESHFTVKKNGQDIATLSVLEIRDVMTACNVQDIKDGQKISANDIVRIK